MNQSNNKEFEMAVGTSSMLESNIMEGENFYTPMESATEPEPEPATQSTWSGVKNDTGQLCRSCANSSDCLIPIYEGEGLEHQLEYKIQKHLPIQVSATDTLPLQLCYQCASTLIAWDSMINSCIEADKKLRAMQEAAEEEEMKHSEIFDNSHTEADTIDSDDEPLITSKTKILNEKSKATPIKKKILSKAKSKSTAEKNEKTATNSKEGEDKERSELLTERKSGVISEITRKRKFPKEMESISIIKPNGVLKRIYRCKLCGHITNRSNNLKAHIQIHKRVLPYTCEKCGKKYRCVQDGKNYSNNIEVVLLDNAAGHSKKMYRCKICGHSSNRSNNLKKHLRSHESTQTFICENCGEKCRQNENMNYHIKEIEIVTTHDASGKSQKSYRCKICGQTFSRKLTLRSHLISHKPINIFVCQTCGKEYLCEKSLKDHVTNIHGESSSSSSSSSLAATSTAIQLPFKCEYCGQLFADKNVCEEHRHTHVGERPYVCGICGCSFRTQSSLYLHSKIHFTEVGTAD